jgi:preprotein translocase subunit SecA
MAGFLSKLLSFGEGKQLKEYQVYVDKINELEPSISELSNEELRAKTAQFRERIENGAKDKDILPEAFACVREAGKRTLGMRHFDVQLIGGMALNEGKIAEMKTGEGKTLVSTLAGYLNALSGNNVHIVTVNDYLARRDSEWMGQIYKFLGMEVGLIQAGMMPAQRVPAYKADVTYGTNSEFGFDYLRDNMVTRANMRVQRGHHFAIVDEVDSILIDEARTPLIISGAGMQASDTYAKFARIMPSLIPEEDFDMDEAKKTIVTTEVGLAKVEEALGIEDLYADPTAQLANHLQQALRAQFLFHRDIDYIVKDGEVKIVDEFTGRIMEGRRWSEGLHQAIEAKEHVKVREENQTLATITLQNYFRMYEKLSGMTGTAMTEDEEFNKIYGLQVFPIPPNKPVIRVDEDDLVYRTIDGKFNAVADEIQNRNAKGQPCLIGTVSIESSERLSRLLSKRGIKHEILNAKNHEREAHIVAQAGRLGAVTIATNMAGRGTDILLGGNADVLMEDVLLERGLNPQAKEFDEDGNPNADFANEEARADALAKAKKICAEEHERVVEAGGLAVIGTERHESRRIDNQLRGRSGRQGDPGVTQFYLSLEDDIMRLFGGDRMDSIARMMEKTSIPEDQPIQAGMVSKAIETAQRNVESIHYAARKNVLEYDDVMNLQRAAIYEERNAILDGKDLSSKIEAIIEDAVSDAVDENCPPKTSIDDWNIRGINLWAANMTGLQDFDANALELDDAQDLKDDLVEYVEEAYENKQEQLGEQVMKMLQSQVMLRIMDTRWMSHLQEMDYLKAGIGLRAYGQRDPLTEYREEAHQAFGRLTASMYEDYLRTLLRLQVTVKVEPEKEQDPLARKMSYSSPEANINGGAPSIAKQSAAKQAAARNASSVKGMPQAAPKEQMKPMTYEKDKNDPYANCGRNDPCPCGSGKKFKKCHGA